MIYFFGVRPAQGATAVGAGGAATHCLPINCQQRLNIVSQFNHCMRTCFTAIAAAVMTSSCATSAPKHPAPVVASTPEPAAQVAKAYPAAPTPEVTGEEIEGSVLPDATEPRVLLGMSLDGKPVYLSDFKSKVVIASYWASWCPPCWTELQQLQEIHAEYTSRDVVIVAINFGEVRAAIDGFLKQQQKPLRFTILSDRTRQQSAAQGVGVVPTTLVFDAAGEVSRRYTGIFGFSAQKIRGDIDRLLRNRG